MKQKYPLAGTDERNSSFFKKQKERLVARAQRLTHVELLVLIERGGRYESQDARAILDGKPVDELDDVRLRRLGRAAERFIDGRR